MIPALRGVCLRLPRDVTFDDAGRQQILQAGTALDWICIHRVYGDVHLVCGRGYECPQAGGYAMQYFIWGGPSTYLQSGNPGINVAVLYSRHGSIAIPLSDVVSTANLGAEFSQHICVFAWQQAQYCPEHEVIEPMTFG